MVIRSDIPLFPSISTSWETPLFSSFISRMCKEFNEGPRHIREEGGDISNPRVMMMITQIGDHGLEQSGFLSVDLGGAARDVQRHHPLLERKGLINFYNVEVVCTDDVAGARRK